MKKILIIDFAKNWGGAQVFIKRLIKGLIQNNLQVSRVIKPQSDSADHSIDNCNTITFLPKKLSQWLEVIKALISHDIIHFHREHDLWLILVARILNPKIKIVYSVHNHLRRKPITLNLCDHIVSNSNYTAKTILQNINPGKITTIYPSLNLEVSPGKESNIQLTGNPILLMSGAFWKDQHKLLPIIQATKDKYPNIHLYLIGPNKDQDQRNNLIDSIDRFKDIKSNITLLESKPRDEYLSLLQQADIFVYSFTGETFGLAILEACLANKTIISYKGGGSAEILKAYKKGMLVEDNNSDSFVQALLNSIKNKDKEDINKDFKELFSEKTMIKNYITLYDSL